MTGLLREVAKTFEHAWRLGKAEGFGGGNREIVMQWGIFLPMSSSK